MRTAIVGCLALALVGCASDAMGDGAGGASGGAPAVDRPADGAGGSGTAEGTGVPASPACWQQAAITLHFNPSLDPQLDDQPWNPVPPIVGDSSARLEAMQAAVQAWNRALAEDVGTDLHIELVVDENAWAAKQDAPSGACPGTLSADDGSSGLARDGTSEASTALSTAGPASAGWVFNGHAGASSPIDRLAEARLDVEGARIAEGDLVWFTHTEQPCDAIGWSYRRGIVRNARRYDYYSVMLHAIGHLLGLDHRTQSDPVASGRLDVMRPVLDVDQELEIVEGDVTALQALYGPGGCRPVVEASAE